MAIIPNLQVFEDRGAGFRSAGEHTCHALGFEGGEEALHHGIIVAVACPAHAEFGQNRVKAAEVGVAGILAALIGVVQQSGGRASPTPFDTLRSKHWAEADLLAIVPHIDAVETFNARCLRNAPNQQAEVFAAQHSLLATVGSDAHSLFEVGRASLLMPAFDDAAGFKKALAEAHQRTRLSPGFVHLFSRFASFYKRINN